MIFRVENFEGPLDLLVYLVKRKKMDIRDIPISQLADEFIEYMESLERADIDLSADFMSTASFLMEMKSKALLPRLSEDEKEEFEEKKERFMKLIENYAKVKEIVEDLTEEDVKPRFPVRVLPRPRFDNERIKNVIESVVNSVKLKERVYRVKRESIGIEEAVERILELDFPVELMEIFEGVRSRYEFVVILLAVLELLSVGKLRYEDGKLVIL